MRRRRGALCCFLFLIGLSGCAMPATTRSEQPGSAGASSGQSKTLIMSSNTEVNAVAPKLIGPTNPARTTRLFGAALALSDGHGDPRPYLAEVLPQLNTDSWRVNADGTMDTVWRLRAGLTWHDGAPLTAEDFLLGWRVYTAPGLTAYFRPSPQELVEAVQALDERTLLIRWRTPYAGAAAVVLEELDPLPAHLLQSDVTMYRDDPET